MDKLVVKYWKRDIIHPDGTIDHNSSKFMTRKMFSTKIVPVKNGSIHMKTKNYKTL